MIGPHNRQGGNHVAHARVGPAGAIAEACSENPAVKTPFTVVNGVWSMEQIAASRELNSLFAEQDPAKIVNTANTLMT
jgi:hypothetical protein